MSSALLLSPPSRARQRREWNGDKAVTFIVTLAATRTVTLAARAAGMSRRSAYALRERDPAFAAAWRAAFNACQGNKVDEVEDPPISHVQGNSRPPRFRAVDALRRDRYFGRLASFSRDFGFSSLLRSNGEGNHPQDGGGVIGRRVADSPPLP